MFRARQESSLFLKKLLLLLVFLLIYLVLCRVEDILFMRRWDAYRTVDPSSLSIRTLTSVLSCRGIQARGVFERHDLLDLVRSSGSLTNLEVNEAIRSKANPINSASTEKPAPKTTELSTVEFNSLEQFNELTEHNAWVIEVRKEDSPAISAKTWYRLSQFLKAFNIHTGRLLCHKYIEICYTKDIYKSGLLLISPKDRSHLNESITFSWFPNIVTMPRILSWLEAALAKRVFFLDNERKDLDSFSFTVSDFIVALEFDRLNNMPLLFSALSIRFDGLIRFWGLSSKRAHVLFGNPTENSTNGTFFFINGDIHYEYGKRPEWSEITAFRAIEFFLRTNNPDSNDVLKVLVVIVCMLALLSMSVNYSDSFDQAFVYSVRSFLIYVYFFIFYYPVVYVLSMRDMQHISRSILYFYQSLALSEFGGLMRRDYLAGRFSALRIIVLFSVFLGASIVIIKGRRTMTDEKATESEETDKKRTKSRHKARFSLSRNILKQECSICHEYCRLNEILRTLACGHAFHQRCILAESFCPNCHFPIKER